jgi:chemotaxis signal transduction protein
VVGVLRALIPLQVQKVWLALEASSVREVLGERPWVRVRPMIREIPGVIPWQGRAIALLDLGTLFEGMQPLQPDERRCRTLVAHVDEATVAIPVDAVMEVVEVDESHVRPCQLTRLGHCAREVELRGIPTPLFNLSEALHAILSSKA